MSKIRKFREKTTFFFITVMFFVITSVSALPMGAYTNNSDATTANELYYPEQVNLETYNGCYPAIVYVAEAAAVAGGVILAAFFVTGVIDGWNSVHPEPIDEIGKRILIAEHNAQDFSKFDN
jgi:hypothetical protein